MKNDVYMNQGLDLKRLVLVLGKKIWLLLAGIVAGALIGGITYKIVTGITNGHPEYRASADYYITFNFDEFEHGDDYYNAYTWDSILRDDPIVDYALTLLPKEITKDMVKASVSGEMLGDYRILTVHVTTETKELADTIAKAYQQSLAHFGEEIELLDKIEVWSQTEASLLEKNTKTGNAAFLGGLIGFLLVLFCLLGYYVLEDAVYVERDVKERFGLSAYGMTTRNNNEKQKQILGDNLKFAFGDEPIETWNVEFVPTREDYDRLREAEHLLLNIPWGRNNGKQIDRLLGLLKIQKCKVDGCVITDADDNFIKAYYGISSGKSKDKERKI